MKKPLFEEQIVVMKYFYRETSNLLEPEPYSLKSRYNCFGSGSCQKAPAPEHWKKKLKSKPRLGKEENKEIV